MIIYEEKRQDEHKTEIVEIGDEKREGAKRVGQPWGTTVEGEGEDGWKNRAQPKTTQYKKKVEALHQLVDVQK